MNAKISAISRHRFGIDGIGIRTLIAFSNCPLRCKYCLNKFTWDKNETIINYEVNRLLECISVDDIYFTSTGGGVTFGGGEPLLQSDFIAEFISKSPKSWDFIVETSLAVPFESVNKLCGLVSKFVVDVKTLDAEIYEQYTGKSVDIVLQNLLKLKEIEGGDKIKIRVPIIPGYVDKKGQKRTVNKLKKLGFDNIEGFTYVVK